MAIVNGRSTNDLSVPVVDGAAGGTMPQVLGTKGDAASSAATASSMALSRQILAGVGGGDSSHVRLFTGAIYYTDVARADDTGDGKTPETAKKTIAATTALMSAGDRFVTKAGTYAENVTMTLASMEWEPEIGTVIAPASGVALTVSGAYCKVWMPGGSLFITAAAGETGVLWSGNRGYPSDIRVASNSSGTIGFDLTGNGIAGDNLRCSNPLTAAFKVQGDKVKLEDCCTGGEVVDTSIGFWVTNSCDKTRLKNCGSQGHASGGYVVNAGVTNGVAKDCESGGGDGRRVDTDNAFVWSNYTFDDEVYKTVAFTVTGAQTYNLFRVYGSVIVTEIFGDVTEAVSANMTACHLELWDGAASDDITKNDGVFSALPVGSLIVKTDKADKTIDIGDATTGVVIDEVDAKKEGFRCVEKTGGVATYIRLSCTSVDAPPSGTIHWHLRWMPMGEGFVEAV